MLAEVLTFIVIGVTAGLGLLIFCCVKRKSIKCPKMCRGNEHKDTELAQLHRDNSEKFADSEKAVLTPV